VIVLGEEGSFVSIIVNPEDLILNCKSIDDDEEDKSNCILNI